jgi:hypothetical protein
MRTDGSPSYVDGGASVIPFAEQGFRQFRLTQGQPASARKRRLPDHLRASRTASINQIQSNVSVSKNQMTESFTLAQYDVHHRTPSAPGILLFKRCTGRTLFMLKSM